MELIPISQCSDRYSIKDTTKPALANQEVPPALKLEGQLYGLSMAFQNPKTQAPELIQKGGLFGSAALLITEQDLLNAGITWSALWVQIFPSYNLSFLSEIKNNDYSDYFNFSDLLKEYQIRPSENLNKLLEIISKLSQTEKLWLAEKKFHVQDLLLFLSAPTAVIQNLIQICQRSKASKAQSVSIIDWLGEWILMHSLEDYEKIKSEFELLSSEKLVKKVHQLRFPHTTTQDQIITEHLSTITWPQQTKASVARRGDRLGFDIQLFVSNPIEFKKNLVALERVLNDWKE